MSHCGLVLPIYVHLYSRDNIQYLAKFLYRNNILTLLKIRKENFPIFFKVLPFEKDSFLNLFL